MNLNTAYPDRGSKPFKNCSIEVSKLPLDVFMLIGDSMKKGVLICRNRKTLLASLAAHADADGTNCYPSRETLADMTCFSVRTIARYLRDLELLGFIRNKGYRWESGPRIRDLVMPRTTDEVRGKPDGKGDGKATNAGHIEREQEGHLNEQEGHIEEAGVSYRTSRKDTIDGTQPASLNPPVLDPPPNPPDKTQKHEAGEDLKDAVKAVRDLFKDCTDQILSTEDASSLFVGRLPDAVRGSVEDWLDRRNRDGMKNPSFFLKKEFADYYKPTNRQSEGGYSREQLAAIQAQVDEQNAQYRAELDARFASQEPVAIADAADYFGRPQTESEA